MIDGVTVTPLKQIGDERGKVMHMLRADSAVFERFGEIYFSTVFPAVVKAWHIHQRMILNYAVPLGDIKLVIYDDRPTSPTKGEVQEVIVGSTNYVLVTMPPLVWTGFKGLGKEMALVANCASIPHDPAEIERKDPRDPGIPYDWDKNG
jgi:dTDP-4-dehydrorhamnose 3,5-epimerase